MTVPIGPFDTEARARAAAQADAYRDLAAALARSLPQPRDGGHDA